MNPQRHPSRIFIGCVIVGLIAICTWLALRSRKSAGTTDATGGRKAGDVAGEILRHSGGQQVKLVWIQTREGAPPDIFGAGSEQILMGFDTSAGQPRRLSNEVRNFSRPLLTPDGKAVLYTDRGRKQGNGASEAAPVIHLLDWESGADQILGPGFAVDVVSSAENGPVWIYALRHLNPENNLALDGEDLFRFHLDNPGISEPVWNLSTMAADNLQVSRDGNYLAGLFPWPDAGIIHLPTKSYRQLDPGCWPSLAPDNSYVSWVFDGTHKKIHVNDGERPGSWTVPVHRGKDLHGEQTYHPRWSNHPLYFTLTGPYASKTEGRGRREQNLLSKGAHHAEIFLLKFAPDLHSTEATLRITTNELADAYPDAWVAGGNTAVLEKFPQRPAPVAVKEAKTWPGTEDGLLFVWARADAENRIAGRNSSCRATAKGIARYGRGRQMLLDGGYFQADEASDAALALQLRQAGALTIEFLLTETGAMAPGAELNLFAIAGPTPNAPILECVRKGATLLLRNAAGAEVTVALEFEILKPHHLLVTFDRAGVTLWVDGELQTVVGNLAVPADFRGSCGLRFGDPAAKPDRWSILIENVAIFSKKMESTEARQRHALSKPSALPPATHLKLRGRLVQTTEADLGKLGSYQRMLIGQTYEVQQVLLGKYDAKQVVVMHWGILDRQLVVALPKEIGSDYVLELEPLEAHPGLTSELQEVDSNDLESQIYVDVSRPKF